VQVENLERFAPYVDIRAVDERSFIIIITMEASKNLKRKEPDSVKFEGLPFDGSSLGSFANAAQLFTEWRAPAEGLNIQGGAVTMQLPYMAEKIRVFVKRMPRNSVLNAIAADRIRDEFFDDWCTSVGTHSARLIFNKPFTIPRPNGVGRGDITIKTKSTTAGDWFLVSEFINTETLREYVKRVYGLDSPKLALPEWNDENATFMQHFTNAFALRMVLGVTDPGPGNWLAIGRSRADSTGSLSIWSIDEGSAFSSSLDPTTDKPWLRANLAGAQALKALGHPRALKHVEELERSWKEVVANPAEFEHRVVRLLERTGFTYSEGLRRASYVRKNVGSLLADWRTMVSV
jgi:hypothetical protein